MGGHMKDKRNCNGPYPMYGMPMMMPQMQVPNTYQNTFDINSIDQRLNMLDERVSRLEKLVSNNNTNNYNKYNNDNYYMV